MYTHTIELTRQPTPKELLADPACSTWLKEALTDLLANRDPIDALRDCELLTAAMAGYVDRLFVKA